MEMKNKLLRSWGLTIPMTLFLGVFNLSPIQAQDAPAFPGAEGHGRYVTGGRGGKVILGEVAVCSTDDIL